MYNIALRSFLLLGCLLCFSPQTWAQLEVSPKIQWKTLNTPHFEVIFNAEQQDLGELYGLKLEKAYHDLQSYFQTMSAKTIVVINDKTDVTNGYATPIPYSHIMAYPVLPGPEDSLADTGDWAYELLSHEFTHVLTFAPHGGIMRPLHAVFGTIIAPTLLLPRWWKEGVAVEMETRLSAHGRLRSVYQDSSIRAMVADKTFLNYDIAEANEGLPTWPQGSRPYLFGSLMWSQMIADHGAKVVAELHERHGRRVPYFINQPAEDNLDANYSEQYQKMQVVVSDLASAQIGKLQTVPPTPMTLPRNRFNSVSAPAISADGKRLALITENDAGSREIKIITRENPQQSFLDVKDTKTVEEFNEIPNTPLQRDTPASGNIQRVNWFPDSSAIVYDKIDYSSRYDRFSDLYIYDFAKKKVRQITKSLRAREPSPSLDGRSVVFVKLSGGKTELATLSIEEGKKEVSVLFTPPLQERISYPIFWDEKTVIFSWRKESGDEHLYKFDIGSSNPPQMILSDFPNARFPRKTGEGLMFSSSKNGTHNIYVADAGLKGARPLTHTITANFSSDLDPLKGELFVTTMTSQGLRVGSIAKDDWSKTPAALPVISPLLADRYAASTSTETKTEPTSAEGSNVGAAKSEIEDYSALGYLLPRYWIPFILGSSSETGIILQAMTTAFDPLKKHTYSLLGTWDTGLGRGSFEATYVNQTTRLPWTLFGYQRASYLGTVDNRIDDYGGVLVASPNMFWLSRYAGLQLGWKYAERKIESTNGSVKRMGPTASLSYANYSQSGAEVSPESGWGGFLGTDYFIEKDDYLQYTQYTGVGLKYFSNFLPRHHALMIRVAALHTPDLPKAGVAYYGSSTESLVFVSDSVLPQYILRGYTRGQILGRNIANANIEYRFPIYRMERGSGTVPLFLHNLVGSFIGDGVAADGFFFDNVTGEPHAIRMNTSSYWTAGGELKLETTLGYTFPFNVILGYYAAFNQFQGTEYVLGSRIQFSGF